MAGIAVEAVVTLPPATAPCSPALRRRHDLSWFRNRPKSPTQREAIVVQTKYLAQNLPPARQHDDNELTSGRGQPVKPPGKLARRATDGVSRIWSSLRRKDRCLSRESCLDQMTTQLPLSDAHLRRRAYSCNHTIYQTLAGSETPPRGSVDLSGNRAVRLLTAFPDVGEILGDFACTLDHAGMRWYGRIFVGRSCLCFTGTGITLSGTMSTGRKSPPPVYRWGSEEPASFRSLSTVKSPHQWPATSVSSTSLVANNRPESPPLGKNCRPWRKTALKISFNDITRVSKELTMGLWPNAMTLATGHRQYIFTNFLRRDRAHQCLSEAWQLHCQQRKMLEKYPLTVERLPMATRKSLSKPWHASPHGNNYVPPLLATYSVCESESTICEHPSFVTRRCSTNSNQNTRSIDISIDKHDDDVDMFALMLHTFGSKHALFLAILVMCCLLSLTSYS